MAPKRYRCVRCRSRIDPDLHTCPYCEAEDPLRYRRVRRVVAAGLALAAVLSLSAWVLLA
ncbi:MAG: hypothetical protein PVJ02_15900 [Gemmatimonadota bacterium]